SWRVSTRTFASRKPSIGSTSRRRTVDDEASSRNSREPRQPGLRANGRRPRTKTKATTIPRFEPLSRASPQRQPSVRLQRSAESWLRAATTTEGEPMAATNTLVRTIAKNALAPLAASAAAFGVKKLSPVFDEKVLPKLRELGRPRELASGAAAKASAPLQRVKDA